MESFLTFTSASLDGERQSFHSVCDFIILSAGAKYSQLQMDSVGAAIWLCKVLYIAK